MRTQAGTGSIDSTERVDSNFIVDFSSRYKLNKNLTFTANMINILDTEYAVSRQPAGLRPGHPFGINAGLVARFNFNKHKFCMNI